MVQKFFLTQAKVTQLCENSHSQEEKNLLACVDGKNRHGQICKSFAESFMNKKAVKERGKLS